MIGFNQAVQEFIVRYPLDSKSCLRVFDNLPNEFTVKIAIIIRVDLYFNRSRVAR